MMPSSFANTLEMPFRAVVMRYVASSQVRNGSFDFSNTAPVLTEKYFRQDLHQYGMGFAFGTGFASHNAGSTAPPATAISRKIAGPPPPSEISQKIPKNSDLSLFPLSPYNIRL